MNPVQWLRGASLQLGAISWLTGCSGRAATMPNDESAALRAAITNDVASHMTADGQFALRPDLTDPRPILGEMDARAIALTAARRTGHMIGRKLEAEHGGPIEYSRLRSCGRGFFARTPFADLPQNLPPEAVYYLGSHWIIPVCSPAGSEVISVAVAANARIVFRNGNDVYGSPSSLSMMGIPSSWHGALPIGPERAAILLAGATGRRVAAVPEFYAPNPGDGYPQAGVWLVPMDGPVVVRGDRSGSERENNVFFVAAVADPSVGFLRGEPGLYVILPSERRGVSMPIPFDAGPVLMNFALSPSGHIDFERAVVLAGGRP